MVHGMRFASLSLTVLILSVLAQAYLFFRIRQAVKSSNLSGRLKSGVIVLAGIVIVLLYVANRYIMFNPILWVDPPTAVQVVFFYPPVIWGFGSIFSALLLGITRAAGGLGRIGFRFFRGFGRQEAAPPVNFERRRFLRAGVGGLAAVPLLITGYGVAYAGKDYEVAELSLPFGRALRVVQLTDIHAGIYMKSADMRRLADRVTALEPDLFVLTGDYITNSMEFLPSCVEEMARVRARYGTFAVLGNHEYWYGELSEILSIFSRYRIPLLQNEHRLIHSEQGPFAVAGINDLRSGRPDLDAALRGLDHSIPKILLSHRPEIFPEAAARRIPITLAGHYHGGQVKLSLPTGDFSLAGLVTPYPAGLYRIDSSNLYVSRGIGTTFTPVRLNVPPEITLLHLT
jgi:uncharacterized protein